MKEIKTPEQSFLWAQTYSMALQSLLDSSSIDDDYIDWAVDSSVKVANKTLQMFNKNGIKLTSKQIMNVFPQKRLIDMNADLGE